jgi:uncharacterized protein with NAD-binding domain and iron-sulfur cluster
MATDPSGPSASAKVKVAILGGGPSGLSTAFWLTATPALRERFEVAVYTPGWRLGGKCASGRNQGRIQEHGLHVLMGCYRNVFATLCACYDEWKPPPGGAFQHWSDAFTPQFQVSLPEQGSNGDWAMWNFILPKNDGVPCAATPAAPALADLMIEHSRRLQAHVLSMTPAMSGNVRQTMAEFRDTQTATESPSEQEVTRLVAQLQALEQQVHPRNADTTAAPEATATGVPLGPGWLCPGSCPFILANLGFAIMRGYLSDVFLRGDAGIAKLDQLDFRAWLATHGARAESLASAPMRALYDLTFAFPKGNSSNIADGAIAAGVTLRFILEACFGYAGAPLWKMNAGTGDTLFTPLYQVLQARGVAFNFFHRVTDIALGADGKIATIGLAQQARVTAAAYAPLVPVEHLECWPAEPLWDQLQGGRPPATSNVDFESAGDTTAVARVTLAVGTDFEVAVLATPPDILARVATGLDGHDARWDAMRQHSSSVATAAFQLWLNPPLEKLGWTLGTTILTAYVAPFGSWGDMSHLIPREPPSTTQTIAYFCGCIGDPAEPIAQVGMAEWLKQHIAVLWPKAGELAGGDGLDAASIVNGVYLRFNISGSERYVLTPPGSVQYRLSPQQSLFGNLYVAGDWTLTRFSGGCVEAAFESGVLAAAAMARDLAPPTAR